MAAAVTKTKQYHANVFFLDIDGKERMKQLLGLKNLVWALHAVGTFVMQQKTVTKICIIESHYNKDDYNYRTDYLWYRHDGKGHLTLQERQKDVHW